MKDEAKMECNHRHLIAGDRIYTLWESDFDICFDKIENIQFCPLCGMKLKGITIKDSDESDGK